STTIPTVTTPTVLPGGAAISKVFVLSAPDRVAPGSQANVCWRVEGSGKIPHTAIHFDAASHPNSTAFADYVGGAGYPGDGTTPAAAGYVTPGPFCSNLKMPASGAIYFRAHELVPGSSINNLSAEKSITVGRAVSVYYVAPTAP